MARIHGLIVLAAIAAGTSLWFFAIEGEPPAPPLPEADAPSRSTDVARPDAAIARTSVDAAPQSQPVAKPAEPAAPSEAPPQHVAIDTPITLRVYRQRDRAPLPQFSWRFTPESGEITKGVGADGAAALPIARGMRGTLLIEADAMQALAESIATPLANMPSVQLDRFLVDAALLARVTLQLNSATREPVQRARLDLWRIDGSQAAIAPNEDPAHEPLWKRTGEDPSGTLTLPEIAVGDYALRAQPVDQDGFALPLQPARFRFTFRGGESIPLRAECTPGCVLRIDCADDGNAAVLVDITTKLAFYQDPIRVPWQSRGTDGRAASGLDAAMLPGRAQSAIALPPGVYLLEAQRGDGARVARSARYAGRESLVAAVAAALSSSRASHSQRAQSACGGRSSCVAPSAARNHTSAAPPSEVSSANGIAISSPTRGSMQTETYANVADAAHARRVCGTTCHSKPVTQPAIAMRTKPMSPSVNISGSAATKNTT